MIADNKPKNIIDVVCEHNKAKPQEVLYRFVSGTSGEYLNLTYSDVYESMYNIAQNLGDKANKGERALLIYEDSENFITAFLGCLAAGVIAVPLSVPRTQEMKNIINYIVSNSDSSLIMCDSKTRKKLEGVLTNSRISYFETDGCLSSSSKIRTHTILPDDIAFLQYTSGSTGEPKGVMVTHANIMNNLDVIRILFGHTTHSVGCSWLPHYHDMGLLGGILQPLFVGFPVVLMAASRFIRKPFYWLSIISEYGVTTSGGPNFAYDLCIKHVKEADVRSLDLSRWCVAFNGAEPVVNATLENFNEKFQVAGFSPASHYPCYGMAETTLLVSGLGSNTVNNTLTVCRPSLSAGIVLPVDDHNDNSRTLVSNGICAPGHEIIIVSEETGKKVKEGNVGEIWVTGPSVTSGYWKRPALTNNRFKATSFGNETDSGQRYYRTGDLGFLYSKQLYVCGRQLDKIIVRGRNYFAEDIEYVLTKCMAELYITAMVVFGVTNGTSENLILLVEVPRNRSIDFDACKVCIQLRSAIRRHFSLELYDIVFLQPRSLLKTTSGKVRRKFNKESYANDDFSIVDSWQRIFNENDSVIEQKQHFCYVTFSALDSTQQLKYLRKCIIADIARHLDLGPQSIDMSLSLGALGFDSIKITELLTSMVDIYRVNGISAQIFYINSVETIIVMVMEQLIDRITIYPSEPKELIES